MNDNRLRGLVLFGAINVGDFVTFGRELNPTYSEQWWKVEAIEGDTLHIVNKGGSRRAMECPTWRGIKIYKWFTQAQLEAMARR